MLETIIRAILTEKVLTLAVINVGAIELALKEHYFCAWVVWGLAALIFVAM